MTDLEIKKQLIDSCNDILLEKANSLEKAMDQTQEAANAHKGAMESRYDSFKEATQEKKNRLGKQLKAAIENLLIIRKIKPLATDKVRLGAIVETKKICYFISTYVTEKPILIGNKKYFPISKTSPIGQIFMGKETGETVTFREKKIKIEKVF